MLDDPTTSQRGSLLGWPSDRWPLSDDSAASPDAQLVSALRAGDERAFCALVRRHHETMVGVARHFVASRSVAEEVVQETWLAVVRQLDTFEERSSLRTWIYRILVNRARSRGAREHRIVPFSALGPADGDRELEDPTTWSGGAWATSARPWQEPERRLLSLEARGALRAALAQLPPRQRTVVTLRDVEGFDTAEVAELLGLSEANARVLLHRGRTRLRQALADVVEIAA